MKFFGKKMSQQELGELRAINKLIKQEEYKAHVLSKNTYSVHKGQDYLKSIEGLVALLKAEQQNLVSHIAARAGFEVGVPVEVNLETGSLISKPKVDAAEESAEKVEDESQK